MPALFSTPRQLDLGLGGVRPRHELLLACSSAVRTPVKRSIGTGGPDVIARTPVERFEEASLDQTDHTNSCIRRVALTNEHVVSRRNAVHH